MRYKMGLYLGNLGWPGHQNLSLYQLHFLEGIELLPNKPLLGIFPLLSKPAKVFPCFDFFKQEELKI